MVLSVTEAALVGSIIYLAYLLIRYPNRAIGTAHRPDLPHPKGGGWPIIGDLIRIASTRERALENGLKIHREHGTPTSFTLPFGVRMINCNRPDWIEHIQKTNFNNYVKGDFQHDIFRDLLGDGIFATDGHTWNRQRKASSHIFSAGSFRTVIGSSIDQHLDILVRHLDKAAISGDAVTLNQVFFRFTLDTFVKMSFSYDIGSLEAGKPVPFAEAFDFAQSRLDLRFMEPLWHITERFSATGRKMRLAIKTIDAFIYDIIDSRDRAGEKGEGGTDLLSLYRGVRDEKGEGMSRKELRDAVLNLILAGRDTTAQALSYSFFYLTHNPSLLEPIRKEIRELGSAVTYDTYRSYVRTTALFSEVIRLHPPVPKNGKFALGDDVLPNGGPVVKAGDVIGFSDWIIARDTSVWGEDAAEMKPERWIDDDGKSLRRFDQWQYHVFNGGPRLCLGMNLATYEAVAAIVALVRRFDFAFAPGYLDRAAMSQGVTVTGPFPTPLYHNSVTLPMKDPMDIIVTRLKEPIDVQAEV